MSSPDPTSFPARKSHGFPQSLFDGEPCSKAHPHIHIHTKGLLWSVFLCCYTEWLNRRAHRRGPCRELLFLRLPLPFLSHKGSISWKGLRAREIFVPNSQHAAIRTAVPLHPMAGRNNSPLSRLLAGQGSPNWALLNTNLSMLQPASPAPLELPLITLRPLCKILLKKWLWWLWENLSQLHSHFTQKKHWRITELVKSNMESVNWG